MSSGKESVLYLLDLASMGKEMAGNTQIVQSVALGGGAVKPSPAYWYSPAGGLVYVWAENDVLRAFHFNGATLDTPAYASGSVQSPGSPGGTLAVSANGSKSGTGIVWSQMSTSQDDDHGLAAGILRAYNAESLQEIWNSEQMYSRDRLGTLVKFVPPVAANGKVFAATQDNAIAVYGLLPDFSITATPLSQTTSRNGAVKYTITVGSENGFAGIVNLKAGAVKGANETFTPASVTGSGTSTLTISTTNATTAGFYGLTITGTNDSNSHSTTVALTVTKR